MRNSFQHGLIWAILLISVALFLMPGKGVWVVDDCVKRIAASGAQGMWAERIPNGPIRSQLDNPEQFAPLIPPFARVTGEGLVVGFAPAVRLLFKGIESLGDWAYRIVFVLIAIAVWLMVERSGIPYGFLLFPLTFYALVPWEHALSWLCLWPATWLILCKEKFGSSALLLAGIGIAAAILLRTESAILACVLFAYLVFKRRFAPAGGFAIGVGVGIGVFLLVHGLTSSEPAWIHLTLNSTHHLVGSAASDWLSERATAIYYFLMIFDSSDLLSATLLVVTLVGFLALWTAEKKRNRLLFVVSVVLLTVEAGVFQYRIWTDPLPSLALATANSLFACLPWTLMALLPPYRGRTAFYLFGITILITLVLTPPVWHGVHWGPRVLLFALPLLVIDLWKTERMKGWTFATLLVITAIQTVGSGAVVYARAKETAARYELSNTKMGSPVVCSKMYECADLALLWKGREFFSTTSVRELRQLAIQFREAKIDTFWMNIGAGNRLYVDAFPDGGPVRPHRMSVIRTGTFYTTWWRIYELVTNRSDSTWAEIYQSEAGSQMQEGNLEKALRWQKEAVNLKQGSAETHFNLALVLGAMGRPEDAQTEIQTSLRLDNEFKPARELMEKLRSNPAIAP